MELLAPPRTSYLLDASLESLHVESQEWLREIDFWRDEIFFFYKLLRKQWTGKYYPGDQLAAMEKKLVSISSDKVDKLRKDVLGHERLLAGILRVISVLEEEKYRDTYRKLLMEIHSIHRLMQNFKREVFAFVQKFE